MIVCLFLRLIKYNYVTKKTTTNENEHKLHSGTFQYVVKHHVTNFNMMKYIQPDDIVFQFTLPYEQHSRFTTLSWILQCEQKKRDLDCNMIIIFISTESFFLIHQHTVKIVLYLYCLLLH